MPPFLDPVAPFSLSFSGGGNRSAKRRSLIFTWIPPQLHQTVTGRPVAPPLYQKSLEGGRGLCYDPPRFWEEIVRRQETYRPFLGLTMGDPAGIGPEIVAKAAMQQEVQAACRLLVIGEAGIMARATRLCRLDLSVRAVASPAEATGATGILEVLDLKNIDAASCPPGVLSAQCGRAAVEYLYKAIDLAMARELDGR